MSKTARLFVSAILRDLKEHAPLKKNISSGSPSPHPVRKVNEVHPSAVEDQHLIAEREHKRHE